MADNTSNTNTPATPNAPITNNESAATYTPMNAQEAQAQEVVSENRVDPASVKAADVTSTPDAFSGMDILDAQAGGDTAAALDNIETAAGQPMSSANAGTKAPMSSGLGFDRSVVAHNLNKPAAGQTTTVPVQPGELLATTFDPNAAKLDMQGKNLVLQFEDGGKIVLQDFAADSQNMPSIVLPNGALVAGGVIVAQLQGTQDDIFDLETAAGAGRANAGFFQYSDDLGNVIDLLNKLPPLPFTALEFNTPDEEEVVDFFDNSLGDFTPEIETEYPRPNGTINRVSGGFEDWQPNQHIGDTSEYPAALKITFTPNDNEVVDTVTINNIFAGVEFYYGTANNYAPMPVVNGSLTFTGQDLANGNIFIKAPADADQDFPLDISLLIRDPDTNDTVVLTKTLPVIFDAVADQPELITTAISINGDQDPSAQGIEGNEGNPINIDLSVNFPDKDDSEVHTVTLQGVPSKWLPVGMNPASYTVIDNGDGTSDYILNLTGNGSLNTTLTFNANDWSSDKDNGGNPISLKLVARAEEQVAGPDNQDLVLENNVSLSETNFLVDIIEDIPVIIPPPPENPDPNPNVPALNEQDALVDEKDLNGVASDTGTIAIDFHTDGDFNQGTDDAVKMTLNNLPSNLTSEGNAVTYTLSPDGKTITASANGTTVFTIVMGDLQQAGADHEISYTFTLLQPLDHADGNGLNVIDFPVEFTVTDDDGDSVDGSFTVAVIDDVPVANPDVNNIPGNHTVNSAFATGNILTNDTLSQDGTVIQDISFGAETKSFAVDGQTDANGTYVVIDGAYGTLKVYENGDYRYDYDTVNNSGNNVEQFPYSLIDSDGDTSDTTLTINIKDFVPEIEIPDPQDPNNAAPPSVVDENDLPSNATASDTITIDFFNEIDFDDSTTPADVAFTLEGLPTNLTVDGNTVTYELSPDGKTITGSANGETVLTITMADPVLVPGTTKYTVSYEFDLLKPVDHPTGGGTNNISFPVEFVATDADGDSTQGQITLGIIDDVPVANPDTNTIPGNHTADTAFATGNILTNDVMSQDGTILQDISFGAETKSFAVDGQTDANGTYVMLDGAYGTLKVYENGDYRYDYDTANNSGNNIEQFPYTLIDNDGDTSTTTLTINIKDFVPEIEIPDPQDPNNAAPPSRVDENDLPSNASAGDTITIEFFNEIDFNDPSLPSDVAFTLQGLPTNLTADGNAITYTLSQDGKTITGSANSATVFTISMADPVLVPGTTKYTVSYEFDLVQPVDHPAGGGTNTINFPVQFVATDADGDSTQGQITLGIIDDVPSASPSTVSLDETNGLDAVLTGTVTHDFGADGAGALAANDTFNATGSTGAQLTSGGAVVAVALVNGVYVGTANGAEVFTLQINANGTYTFTQKAALDHADGSNPNDVISLNFGYNVTDFDGDTASGTITVNVRDDAPVAFDDVGTILDGETVATGNVLDNDDLSNDEPNLLTEVSNNGVTKTFANDSMTDADGKYVEVEGDFGTLKVYENGEYRYTYDPSSNAGTIDRFDLPDNALDFPMLSEYADIADSLTMQEINTLVDTANSMQIDFPTTVNIELVKASRGVSMYKNSLGAFTLNDDGTIENVKLLYGDASANNYNQLSGDDLKTSYDMSNPSGRVVFFIVRGGFEGLKGFGLADDVGRATVPFDGALSMQEQTDGSLKLVYTDSNGHEIVMQAPIYTSEISFNADGQSHTIAGIAPGTSNSAMFGFEDLTGTAADGSDRDFNDVMFHVDVDSRYIPGTDVSESFTYTVADSDGDTSQANLNFNIADTGPGEAPDVVRTIDETTDIGKSISDTITVENATQFALGTVTGDVEFAETGSLKGGILASNGVPVTISLVNGAYVGKAGNTEVFVLTINNNGTYNFVQKAPLDHANGSDANDVISLNFTYTARDNDGDSVEGSIRVSVRDDAPVAVKDYNTVAEGETTVSGNVIDNDTLSNDVENILRDASFEGTTRSFDTPDGTDGNGKFVLLDGQFGHLKIYENGEYTYTQTSLPPVENRSFTAQASDIPGGTKTVVINGITVTSEKNGDLIFFNDPNYSGIGIKGGQNNSNKVLGVDEKISISTENPSAQVIVTLSDLINNTGQEMDFKVYFSDNPNDFAIVTRDINFATPGLDQRDFSFLASDFGKDGITKIEISSSGEIGRNNTVSFVLSRVQTIDAQPVSDKFKYTLEDGDNDSSQATLTINSMPGVPLLLVGTNTNDTSSSNIQHEVGGGKGVIAGNTSHDILVGDVGGSRTSTGNKDYNVVMIMDVSTSMRGNKMAMLKDSVKNLMEDMHEYEGGAVKIHLVPFGGTAAAAATFTLTEAGGYQAALKFINDMDHIVGTNYESPMQSALEWLNGSGPIDNAETFTYFVSDGRPNRYVQNNGNASNNTDANRVMDEIFGVADGTNEVGEIQKFGKLVAVGIEVDTSTIQILNRIDSENAALDVKNAEDLSAALQSANPVQELASAGSDQLTGGNGSDLIFGDALNTDQLAQDLGLNTNEGAGWNVFAKLEAENGITRDQVIDYIRDHAEDLARETVINGKGRDGGDDVINGGAGNDVIFGQEGDDVINGGAGNDIISGGTGNNVLTGGEGSDTFLFLENPGISTGSAPTGGHDQITDYSNAQNDKLDISDLLVGSNYTPGVSNVDQFVKIDQTTGYVFVDSSGNGSFNANNHIATINNSSSLDTINVILDDSEGSKMIHTV